MNSLGIKKYDSLDLQVESGSANIVIFDTRRNKKVLDGRIIEISHAEETNHTIFRLNTGFTITLFPER